MLVVRTVYDAKTESIDEAPSILYEDGTIKLIENDICIGEIPLVNGTKAYVTNRFGATVATYIGQ